MNSVLKSEKFPSEQRSILICTDLSRSQIYHKSLVESAINCQFKVIDEPLKIIPTLSREFFDLLLIDVDKKDIDSETLVRGIRNHFSPVEMPILILYSESELIKRNSALAAGANDCLIKPFDMTEAMHRIDNYLVLSSFYKSNQSTRNRLEEEVKARTAKLDLLIESALMMSMERSREKLLHHILIEGQRLLNCDGGTMYLVTKQNTLRFAVRTRDDILPFEEIPLYHATGQANEMYASTYAAIHKKTVIIDDVYKETRFDCSGTRNFDALSGYRAVSLLTTPMAPRGGKVIGILQFFNAINPATGKIVPFPPDVVTLVESLAAQAAVALDNLLLVEGQKATTENIIRTIASAVDSKSPHTGHHCIRVPELALMLAEAACKETQGPFAEFNFKSEDDWFEFRVGAWLHDCGKVTTPEYVIEKATKLDMIYNRIHEIRMRFEVLLRDAQITLLNARINGEDATAAEAYYEQQKNQLTNDFAFIAACNLGKEMMDPSHIVRIKTIAQRKWLRHFDNRLGLFRDDPIRREAEASTRLPVEEFLLSDQPYHIIPRESHQRPEPSLNCKMEIPENLYNYGEIYNLTIQKGTLTAEDRYKINEHIIETIKMLERMPFPDYLQRVPEYATTHHERMDGNGYPRKLTAADLSIPARIMAIADIFEALTSAERPYKEPYKLSETIKILHEMKTNHHIDPDLFDLFLTSGVYRKFAEKFLEPDQIDCVNIAEFLGSIERQRHPST